MAGAVGGYVAEFGTEGVNGDGKEVVGQCLFHCGDVVLCNAKLVIFAERKGRDSILDIAAFSQKDIEPENA